MTATLNGQPTSRIYREWLRRIERGTATMAQCRQFAAVCAPLAGGWSGRYGKRTNLTGPEALDLFDRLQTSPVGLEPRDDAAGRAWLDRWGVSRLHLPPDAVALFARFGFEGDGINYDDRAPLPVWRVHLTDGRSFDYYAASWQRQAWHGRGPYEDPEGWWWHVGPDLPPDPCRYCGEDVQPIVGGDSSDVLATVAENDPGCRAYVGGHAL